MFETLLLRNLVYPYNEAERVCIVWKFSSHSPSLDELHITNATPLVLLTTSNAQEKPRRLFHHRPTHCDVGEMQTSEVINW